MATDSTASIRRYQASDGYYDSEPKSVTENQLIKSENGTVKTDVKIILTLRPTPCFTKHGLTGDNLKVTIPIGTPITVSEPGPIFDGKIHFDHQAEPLKQFFDLLRKCIKGGRRRKSKKSKRSRKRRSTRKCR